jgi:hypothetical protein
VEELDRGLQNVHLGMAEDVTGDGQGWFAATGAVGRYWLAHCDRFEVLSRDGALTGVVAEVELDPAGRASVLVVRRRRGRPLRISPAAVELVDPWQESVVVTIPPRTPRTARVRAVSLAASTTASRAGQGLVSATRRAAPPSGRFAVWLGIRTAYALAFAAWVYGAALFVVSRAATRVLLVVARHVARLVVWIAPRLARAAQTTGRKAATLAGRTRRWHHGRRRSADWIPRRH